MGSTRQRASCVCLLLGLSQAADLGSEELRRFTFYLHSCAEQGLWTYSGVDCWVLGRSCTKTEATNLALDAGSARCLWPEYESRTRQQESTERADSFPITSVPSKASCTFLCCLLWEVGCHGNGGGWVEWGSHLPMPPVVNRNFWEVNVGG